MEGKRIYDYTLYLSNNIDNIQDGLSSHVSLSLIANACVVRLYA